MEADAVALRADGWVVKPVRFDRLRQIMEGAVDPSQRQKDLYRCVCAFVLDMRTQLTLRFTSTVLASSKPAAGTPPEEDARHDRQSYTIFTTQHLIPILFLLRLRFQGSRFSQGFLVF